MKHPKTNNCVPTCVNYLTGEPKELVAEIYYTDGAPHINGMSDSLIPLREYFKTKGKKLVLRPYTKSDRELAPNQFIIMNCNHAVVAQKTRRGYKLVVDTTNRFYLENPETIMYIRE